MKDAFSVLNDAFSVLNDAFSVLNDAFSVLKDAFSVLKDAFSVLNDAFSVLKASFSILNDAFSVLKDAAPTFPAPVERVIHGAPRRKTRVSEKRTPTRKKTTASWSIRGPAYQSISEGRSKPPGGRGARSPMCEGSPSWNRSVETASS